MEISLFSRGVGDSLLLLLLFVLTRPWRWVGLLAWEGWKMLIEKRAWCKVLMLSGLLVIGSDSLDWTTKGGEEVEVFVFDGSGRKE